MIKLRTAFINVIAFTCVSLMYFMGRDELLRKRELSPAKSFAEKLRQRELLWQSLFNVTHEQQRLQRFPDAIIVGAESCGTDALGRMLSLHPCVKKVTDTRFFSTYYNKGSDYYREKMPWSTTDDLVLEVTPSYFSWPPIALPKRVKTLLPNAKIIVLLCDPVDRAVMDFMQETESSRIPRNSKYEIMLGTHLRTFGHDKWARFSQWLPKIHSYIFDAFTDDYSSHILSSGMYYYHLLRWKEEFDHVMVVTREEMLKNTGTEVEKLETFLKLPPLLIKEDFIFNNQSNSNCFIPKQANVTEFPDMRCPLRIEARRKAEQSTTCAQSLRRFYYPFNKKLFQLIGREFPW